MPTCFEAQFRLGWPILVLIVACRYQVHGAESQLSAAWCTFDGDVTAALPFSFGVLRQNLVLDLRLRAQAG